MRRKSLAEERPDLLSSWSPNNEISPNAITCGSNKKVLWRCEKDHEWSATVKNRALIGSGCPYCGCRAVLKGFNDLATIHPELVNEWSEKNGALSPSGVAAYSNSRVWWRCDKGHEWYALISSRSDGHGCPYCAGQKVWPGFNDLNTTHPHIAEEWSERNQHLSPSTITSKNTSNVWWHCNECSNEYKAVVSARVNGLTCPFCAGIVRAKRRDELTINRMIDREFQEHFPQLVVIYIAGKRNMQVITDDKELVGLKLTAFVPDIDLVIDICSSDKEIQIKEYVLKKRNIDYRYISDELSEEQVVDEIQSIFSQKHIFEPEITIDEINFIREKFSIWAKNTHIFHK